MGNRANHGVLEDARQGVPRRRRGPALAEAPSASFERAAFEPAPSRAAALGPIDAVAQHMQRAEPSSPVPCLLDRARNLATRDFVILLLDILFEEAIAALEKGK